MSEYPLWLLEMNEDHLHLVLCKTGTARERSSADVQCHCTIVETCICKMYCPRMAMRNDEWVSPLTSVELEKFLHLIKSPAYILIIQFDCTPVHIYKGCSHPLHVCVSLGS